MSVLSIDFETYSEVNIVKCGLSRYLNDPSFEVLLTAYAYDDDDPVVIDHLDFEAIPPSVLRDLANPDITKTAWNCAFERGVIEKAFGIYSTPEQWEDTMILAGQCGLPMSLKGASEALGLGEDEAKMKEGKALIKYFCSPYKPTKRHPEKTRHYPEDAPEKWKTFKKYNGMDVVAERAVRKRLIKYKPTEEEHRFWVWDAKMNERGVRIDRTLAEQAVALNARYVGEKTEEAIALTGMENPKSVAQVKAWLADQEGIEVPSLNKKVIADVVAGLKNEDSIRFMELRKEISKSSTAKYDAMLRSMCEDDHIRGVFKFYGANRTGRFAGSLVQLQNMSKNRMDDLDECRNLIKAGDYESVVALYGGVSDPLSQLVRTALLPEEGHKWLISDFSAIEARCIAWLSGDEWRLKTFRDGGDIYCASASQMFHVPVVKHGENGELRQQGKIAELALGYGGGVNALLAFGADKMGMTQEEMQDTVDRWREASPRVCALWKDLEKTAIKAIRRGGTWISSISCTPFTYEDGILWMTLPSGRRIAYWGAGYGPSRYNSERDTISYMGVEQQSKKWARLETWGGKLAENLTQAMARDCLRESILNLEAAGYDIRAHVHDEVLVTEPIDGRTVEEMSALMGKPIPWAPGLPLRADGYEGKYYFKD